MIGSRAWFALMRRNLIYRKRYFVSTFFEVFLPICGVWVLIAIKNAAETDQTLEQRIIRPTFPTDDNATFTPVTFNDYLTALQSRKICQYNETRDSYSISGLKRSNWQFPLIKCNAQLCTKDGQDAAKSLCEYSMIGITGSEQRVLNFFNFLEMKYPILSQRTSDTFPFTHDLFRLFDSSDAMDTYVTASNYGTYPEYPKLAMGIVFNDNSDDNPYLYDYTLRQNSTHIASPEYSGRPATMTTPDTAIIVDDFAKNEADVCPPIQGSPYLGLFGFSCTGQYIYNGILAFERLVNDFIMYDIGIATYNNTLGTNVTYVSEASVQIAPFPTRQYIASGFYRSLEEFGPLIISLGLLYPVACMISFITQEKELRQKELMKMMSVSESDIGWSWFVSFFLFNMITTLLVTYVSDILYDQSTYGPLFIFWLLSFTSIITFCMAIASLSSKSIRAVLIGILIFFAGSMLSITVSNVDDSPVWLFFISFHPVAAFSYGFAQIGRLEDFGTGLTFDTISLSSGNKSGYSFQNAYASLMFACVFWGFLSYYLNRVIPLDYGQALPFYFPFLPSYWFPNRQQQQHDDNHTGPTVQIIGNNDNIPYEPVGDMLRRQASEGKSIEIHNLEKKFGDKTAVDGLNLSMYSGQITALLGHNGAGKTTTIAMLTGAIAPTSGHATIAGKDIRTQIQSIRQDIGICLQHDCLFPMLTVREHMQFMARLKGLYEQMSYEDAEAQIDQSIQDVALFEKRNTYSKSLSGGMKRKLSVAIAFCGGSKIVLLDEPTSGMDPFSRRFTWNVIRQYRQDRCIILTTHFMDEADILGDRIAIMAEGQLRCAGSSLFLKKMYGVGYQLTIEKSQEQHTDLVTTSPNNVRIHIEQTLSGTAEEVNVEADDKVKSPRSNPTIDERIRTIILSNVPQSSLLNNTGSEVRYQLPINASSGFPKMFEGLDAEADNGSIQSYGVSMTTLDEVFLLVARGDNPSGHKTILSSSQKNLKLTASTSTSSNDGDHDERMHSIGTSDRSGSVKTVMNLDKEGLFFRHVKALTRKRATNFRRDKKAWFCTTLAPTVAVLLGLIFVTFFSRERNLKPISLNFQDLNPRVKEAPKNPISYNSPNDPFLCQPGMCSYSLPVAYFVNTTDEFYGYCGYVTRALNPEKPAWLNPNSCTRGLSSDIMSYMGPGVNPQEMNGVGNVLNSSLSLFESSDVYQASQYGAILFTHEPTSAINGTGNSFSQTVIMQCKLVSSLTNYTDPDECASRFGGLGYVIQYNFTALHAAPMFQALADEAIIREATKDDRYQIKVTIAPFPITTLEKSLGEAEDSFLLFVLIVLSFPIIAGAFGAFIVAERESKAKHLQTVAGVEPSAYWLSSFLWDTLNYQIPLWITIALFFIFQLNSVTTKDRDAFAAITLLLFLYGPAATAFTYCLTFGFKSPSLCTVVTIISSFLIGMGGPLAIFIMEILLLDPTTRRSLRTVIDVVTIVLRFHPTFCLGKGIFYVLNIDTFVYIENNPELSAFDRPVLYWEVVFEVIQIVLYMVLAVQLDKWSTNPSMMAFLKKITNCFKFKFSKSAEADISGDTPMDTDVQAEEERVLSGGANSDLIVISQLMKVYDNGKKAVDNVSLGIPHGQCFGLLGINGAGKTSIMAMLTAEFPPSNGDATLAGYSVSNEPQKTRRRIGYCPQFDAHFANMTGREHIELYASIKGVSKALVEDAAAEKLKEVGLSAYDGDRLCSNYSGGMKRRLSLAIATIGSPQIVFLDECSTGVDPVARREIWGMISDMVSDETVPMQERTSVILTTHSMEECEALCPRIGLMANGKLRCLGSAQHLKNKFGQGFQVEMKTSTVNTEDADYRKIAEHLAFSKGVPGDNPCDVFLTLEETMAAFQSITNDDFLTSMVNSENPIGYSIWRDAQSPSGIDLETLTVFAATEVRMRNVGLFLQEKFGDHILRERQDQKARYEVNANNTRISDIFGKVEADKEELWLDDYGVSQTSLEQVFNMHAAEAEKFKQGRNDG